MLDVKSKHFLATICLSFCCIWFSVKVYRFNVVICFVIGFYVAFFGGFCSILMVGSGRDALFCAFTYGLLALTQDSSTTVDGVFYLPLRHLRKPQFSLLELVFLSVFRLAFLTPLIRIMVNTNAGGCFFTTFHYFLRHFSYISQHRQDGQGSHCTAVSAVPRLIWQAGGVQGEGGRVPHGLGYKIYKQFMYVTAFSKTIFHHSALFILSTFTHNKLIYQQFQCLKPYEQAISTPVVWLVSVAFPCRHHPTVNVLLFNRRF